MTPKKSRDAHPLILSIYPALNNSSSMLSSDEEQIVQAFEDEAERRGHLGAPTGCSPDRYAAANGRQQS
ncbi:hypothetical protein [Pseudomonas chlororaphis]|uniref:hypothetical protein n=1 Tax=Pseudomonas chlororaphis TaxID=587753 RepID=UPI000F54D700|nr:hypothetical protein [Pseudomonas chlororaphis]WDG46329.1 hypothetical protein PUP58_21595 [Pseudomonas chlororaphis]WDG58493.1 hypothetical protein PUP52_22025 [Pseudomonas chlororaphis]WDG64702.1 hypothetical protein PUP59_22020 [Pseudomonas chlororaphis]WDH33392.1 hypothetical protein PUP62_21430 [Pseudomonas chlororaphis]WDH39476.1 hypothetical protein PUP51_21430 [Pseudomonas chlororaphis]